ncbi:MAG: hypothetical protein HZA04_01740 [Nitrospinae bacterium]|nr:hypothetical protein [Nitrospinota bacterium]
MTKNPWFVHTHHISSHFTNALMPVGFFLLCAYFVTGTPSFEPASFYCFIFGMLGGPFAFFSGFADWRTRFQGRSTQIFNHKRIFGVLFMVTSFGIVAWRAMNGEVAAPESDYRYYYLALVAANSGFVTYLGYLGGKFI